MKQKSIFSYVKRNNNNSEGVDGNEQFSSNVKEAPNLKRTKCNSIAKVTKWDDTYLRCGFFLPDDQILNVAATFQKCKNNRVYKFLAFSLCNNCLFVEVSNNEIFYFLTSRFFLFFLMGVPWQTRKYIRGFTMTKSLKSTGLDCCWEKTWNARN